jgi:hypothetical protein
MTMSDILLRVAALLGLLSLLGLGKAGVPARSPLFRTADSCMACHNGLAAASGQDVSIGSDWRASMMANSARDPYWQASVRREVLDRPALRVAIEDECATCHMPMARAHARASGGRGEVFSHLPIGQTATPDARLAADGVSCTLCHQITPEKLGTADSFTGGFSVDGTRPAGERPIFGPFAIDRGRTTIMRSATGFVPTEATHIQQSELCATCHTLHTHARGSGGEVIARLPEQVPYQEWLHSAYRGDRSCQACHMPAVAEPTPISAVLGEPRPGLSRHVFRGGNFFMIDMLNRYRGELSVDALPAELTAAARDTVVHLESETARIAIDRGAVSQEHLSFGVSVSNLAGHKFPTGYPSRRAWLHVTVRDRQGGVMFDSGRFQPDGSIHGNDNDADARRAEPHYDEIRQPHEVQIYESMMADAQGAVTTGLLSGVRFVKDNRLLPRGFDKSTAGPEIAVQGRAFDDGNFGAGGDRVRYVVNIARAERPFQIDAALWFQPIAYRWAQNLRAYDAAEPKRFVVYYGAMASSSARIVTRHSLIVP